MPVAPSVRNPHLAEECDDEFCPRLPCRMFQEGLRRGYQKGRDEGDAAGYGTGYSEGYAAGASSAQHGG